MHWQEIGGVNGRSFVMSMSTVNSQYRQLMQASYEAHREFKDAWKRRADKRAPNVDSAREAFASAHGRLWHQKLEPLQERFATDPIGQIDEIIEFLETDILAFRCGYLKEFFLRHIKQITFNQSQRSRLMEAALKLCSNNDHRRELRDWARLMILLADVEFVEALEKITKEHEESADAEFMLRILLENRSDLKERTTPLF